MATTSFALVLVPARNETLEWARNFTYQIAVSHKLSSGDLDSGAKAIIAGRYSQATDYFHDAKGYANSGRTTVRTTYAFPPTARLQEGYNLSIKLLESEAYAADLGASCSIDHRYGYDSGDCSRFGASGKWLSDALDAFVNWIQRAAHEEKWSGPPFD